MAEAAARQATFAQGPARRGQCEGARARLSPINGVVIGKQAPRIASPGLARVLAPIDAGFAFVCPSK